MTIVRMAGPSRQMKMHGKMQPIILDNGADECAQLDVGDRHDRRTCMQRPFSDPVVSGGVRTGLDSLLPGPPLRGAQPEWGALLASARLFPEREGGSPGARAGQSRAEPRRSEEHT